MAQGACLEAAEAIDVEVPGVAAAEDLGTEVQGLNYLG